VSEDAPALCAGAIVVEAGRLLLVRRANAPGAGRWSVPGGRVEAGESPEEAAARETWEEAGCAVHVERLAGEALIPPERPIFRVLDYFACLDEPAAVPEPGGDASAARFVPLSEVRSLDLVDGLEAFLVEHGVLGP